MISNLKRGDSFTLPDGLTLTKCDDGGLGGPLEVSIPPGKSATAVFVPQGLHDGFAFDVNGIMVRFGLWDFPKSGITIEK